MGLTYVLTDIHGRNDLLTKALAEIARHSNGAPGRIIALGDYVDRGPESRQVVETLKAMQEAGEVECLKGNHEALMMEGGDLWIMNGGGNTINSYLTESGYDPDVPLPPPFREHCVWMRDRPYVAEDEHRIFVHAGLRPNTPLRDQSETELIWIRELFLRAPAGSFPKHVVHGHTPYWEGKEADQPELLPHRTNLDTAAFHTGILTVGVFDPALPGGPVETLRIVAP